MDYNPLMIQDLELALQSAKQTRVSGISISMPFKNKIIQLLDYQDDLVKEYKTCNTVIVKDSKLFGYNADYYGALAILKFIYSSDYVTILGNGCMGQMFNKMITQGHQMISRSLGNWEERDLYSDVKINCTSLGTAEISSPFEESPNCSLMIDLSLRDNKLKYQCNKHSIEYISGIEFYKHNFIKQFVIYTGIQIKENEFNEV